MKSILNIIFAFIIVSLQYPISAFSAEDIVIKGKVTNSTNDVGQAGAHISFVGTDDVTMSGADGTFSLKAPSLSGLLQIETPGFDFQVVPVQGRSEINIRLIPVSNAESFYNNTLLSSYTDNRLEYKNFLKDNVDLSSELSVLGGSRTVAHSGIDASGSAAFIRGIKSINMSSQPLYIVDGIEWSSQDDFQSLHNGYLSNPLALLSPDDIEDIKILKNGTAIYGSKAAGGVVIINTKRAHNMATDITLNISAGIKSPFKSIPMMNAEDYRIYATDIMRGLTGSLADELSSLKFMDDNTSSFYYPSTHNKTNWMDEINKIGFTQNYDLGIRGGDERALYAFSMGYGKNDGNIDKTDFQRLFIRFNSDINLTKNLTTRADIAFSQISRNIFDDGINAYTSPTYLAYIKSPLYSPFQYDMSGNLFSRISDKDELGIGNPLAITHNAEGTAKNYRFTAFLAPKYQFNSKFSISGKAAFSWDKIKEGDFTPDFGLDEIPFYNEQGDYYGEGYNKMATLMTRHSNLLLSTNADYTPIKNDNYLNLKLGYRYQTDTFTNSYGIGYNTGSDNLKSLSVTNPELRSNGSLHEEWKEIGWFATGDYNYLSRYYLSAQASLESDSRFGKQAQNNLHIGGVSWFLSPSVTGAWIVSGENWMKNICFVNYLKLYATYEITGNNNIPFDATRTYFNSTHDAGLAHGLVLANIGNDKLQWETTGTASLGFNAIVLDNRISLNADFYVANTKNLLITKQLLDEYGLKYYYANDGQLKNVGFDAMLSARMIDSPNWKLNGNIKVGHYSNKITALNSGSFTTNVAGGTVLTAVNNPVGMFYGYKTLGVFSTQEEAAAAHLAIVSANGEHLYYGAGDVHYEDVNHDGIINSADYQVIGNPNPDIYGNFGLTLQYKQFTLNTIFTYSLGNQAYNALRANLESGRNLNNQTTNMLRRWTADGQVTAVPRATYGDPMGNAAFSDRWIEDASYLKFRQVSLSYDLPVKAKVIQSLQVWLAVDNLFTVTRYTGSDPEFAFGNSPLWQGIDQGLTPSSRSYRIGFKVGL